MRGAALLLLAGLTSPALAAGEAATDPGLSLADFQTAARTRMMRADADHDGRLSASELAAMRGGASGRRDPGRTFKWLDGNGDGFIDAAEIDAMSARRFARIDADGDGKVTAAERRAARARRPGGRGLGWRDGARPPAPDPRDMDRQND